MTFLFLSQIRNWVVVSVMVSVLCGANFSGAAETSTVENAPAEHDAIGNTAMANAPTHTAHPDAQGVAEAGHGLLTFGRVAAVKASNSLYSVRIGLYGRPAPNPPEASLADAWDLNAPSRNP